MQLRTPTVTCYRRAKAGKVTDNDAYGIILLSSRVRSDAGLGVQLGSGSIGVGNRFFAFNRIT